MANDVVFYTSADAGAPSLDNTAGSLNAVLYACLVTGYNTVGVASIVVASGVATLTTSSAHGHGADKVFEIAGATPSGLNGRKVPLTVGTSTLTYAAPGVADGTATGSITIKRPGLGWTRAANTGNVAIWARTDPAATPQVLRVDDSTAGATAARASMLETWTDVNTFTGQAPTSGQLSGGWYWSKGANTGTAKRWVLVGDGLFFYLFSEQVSPAFTSVGGLLPAAFGDPLLLKPSDVYGTLGAGGPASGGLSAIASSTTLGSTPSQFSMAFSRLSSQTGAAVPSLVAAAVNGQVGSSGPAYTAGVDGGAVFSTTVYVSEPNGSSAAPIRAILPGMVHPLCAGLEALHLQVLPTVVGTDRKLLVVATASNNTLGCLLFDITGPWR